MLLLDLKQSLEKIAENIRAARIAHGWNVAEMAVRSGVSESTIKRFERSGVITSDKLILLLMPLGLVAPLLEATGNRAGWSLEKHERLAQSDKRREKR